VSIAYAIVDSILSDLDSRLKKLRHIRVHKSSHRVISVLSYDERKAFYTSGKGIHLVSIFFGSDQSFPMGLASNEVGIHSLISFGLAKETKDAVVCLADPKALDKVYDKVLEFII